MKYILRYTILNFYTTEESNHIPQSKLLETLQLANFAHIQQCDALISRSRECIDQLIKELGKQSEEQTAATIKQYFQEWKASGSLNMEQLVQTWENQRHRVLGDILLNNTQSCDRFSNINWHINNRISSKHQSSHQMSVNIVFSTLQASSLATNKICVEIDKEKLIELKQVLSSAAEFLDHNLK